MVTIRSNIPEMAEKWAQVTRQAILDAVYRAMVRTALEGESRLKSIIEKEAYDTGRFLRSVNSKIYVSPQELRLIIGSALGYAINIEEGRKPGKWPNISELIKWVGRKLRRQGINTRVNVTLDQLKALAKTGGKAPTEAQKAYRMHLSALFLIGRKIATKGVKEKLFFARMQQQILAFFHAEVQNELNRL